MPRKKKTVSAEAPAEAMPAVKDTAMKSEMRDLTLENDMMKKTLADRKKYIAELRKLKAEEALLIAPLPQEEAAEPPMDDDGGGDHNPEGYIRPENRPPEYSIERNEQFEKTLAEFTDTEGRVEVYRLRGTTYAKIGNFPAKEWGNSLEGVALKFGGGTFKVKLRSPNGSFAGETEVTFDEEAYPKPRPAEANNGGFNQVEMMRMQMERDDRNQDKMMMMMKAMFEAVRPVAQPAPQNLITSMSELAQAKDLFAKTEEKPDPQKDVERMLSLFHKGMEFGASTAPSEGDPSVLSLISKALFSDGGAKVAEMFKAGLTQPVLPQRPNTPPMRPNPPQRPPQTPSLPLQTEVAAAAPAEQPAQEEAEMSLGTKMVISTYRPIIVGYATKNEDPRKVAEMVVSRIASFNESWILIVDDFLKVPTTKEMWVLANAPELRNFEPWVDSVMMAMQDVIREGLAQAEQENGGPEMPDEVTKIEDAVVEPAVVKPVKKAKVVKEEKPQ